VAVRVCNHPALPPFFYKALSCVLGGLSAAAHGAKFGAHLCCCQAGSEEGGVRPCRPPHVEPPSRARHLPLPQGETTAWSLCLLGPYEAMWREGYSEEESYTASRGCPIIVDDLQRFLTCACMRATVRALRGVHLSRGLGRAAWVAGQACRHREGRWW